MNRRKASSTTKSVLCSEKNGAGRGQGGRAAQRGSRAEQVSDTHGLILSSARRRPRRSAAASALPPSAATIASAVSLATSFDVLQRAGADLGDGLLGFGGLGGDLGVGLGDGLVQIALHLGLGLGDDRLRFGAGIGQRLVIGRFGLVGLDASGLRQRRCRW